MYQPLRKCQFQFTFPVAAGLFFSCVKLAQFKIRHLYFNLNLCVSLACLQILWQDCKNRSWIRPMFLEYCPSITNRWFVHKCYCVFYTAALWGLLEQKMILCKPTCFNWESLLNSYDTVPTYCNTVPSWNTVSGLWIIIKQYVARYKLINRPPLVPQTDRLLSWKLFLPLTWGC